MSDWNANIVDEFREYKGQVGGMFEGATLLLLHHTGAKTGTQRVSPLMYQKVGDTFAVFASKSGALDNPDWYHNLIANPDTTIEVGTNEVEVTARVAGDEERDPIWSQQKAEKPQFAEYETTAGGRKIPVVLLETR